MNVKEIKEYWTKKYPNISVSLWENKEESRFFGKMMSANDSFDIRATSIGELISQGESFLRRVK